MGVFRAFYAGGHYSLGGDSIHMSGGTLVISVWGGGGGGQYSLLYNIYTTGPNYRTDFF